MLKKTLYIFIFFSFSLKAQLCLYPASTLTCPANPTCLVSGDFNNDAKRDLALGSQSGITIFQGNGDGSFSIASNITLSMVRSLTCADFNLDGKEDLIALQELGVAKVLIGNGNGTFTSAPGAYPGCPHPLSVLSDDFNNDTKPDLVITNFCAPYFHRYFGDGTGGFATGSMFTVNGGNNCYDGTSADFNSDGYKDLALTSSGSKDVSVFLAQSSGSFSPVVKYPVGTFPEALASGDFNSDGNSDIAVAISGSDSVAVLLGSMTGTFSSPVNYKVGSFPKYIAVKDMNADGKLDILVSNYSSSSNNVAILLNSNGAFLPASYFSVGSNPLELVAEDFNGDQKPDFIVCNKSSNSLSVWLSSFPTISGSTVICAGSAITLSASLAGVNSFTWSTGTVSQTISVAPQTNSNYVVATSNTLAACIASTSVLIQVKPLPTLTVSSTNTLPCKGETVAISVTGAQSYSWNIGVNSSSVIANLSSTFNYSISGTDTAGCINKTVFTQSVSACTSLENLSDELTEILAFPNPSHGTIYLKSKGFQIETRVLIQNLCGQTIYDNNLGNSEVIHLTEAPPGIYILKLQLNGQDLKQYKLFIAK